MTIGATNESGRVMAEINMTPLIDVMLVLLIIFMVVVPVSQRGLDAAIPEPAARDSGSAPVPVLVTVDTTGLRLGAKPVLTVNDLEADLRDILGSRREKIVFVRATGAVPYAKVIEVLDAARGAGAERIGLVPDGETRLPAPGR